MMQKTFLMRGLSLSLYSRTSIFNASNPSFKTPSLVSFDVPKFYTSKSVSSSENPNYSENEIENKNPVDVDDVSSAELKTQIDKFNKGDFEAIPTIFESILKRKLSGKHEDSDDELMNEFRLDQPTEIDDQESDFDSNSEFDSDSDSD